ncbi:dynamin family protein [Phormidium sp. CCY1219]|uniref:dynamin family protein n=1 Tax=Phormidium sp. CCY1219 TaxID=2886104 RepID=UPI002D1E660C|nr:dynamin family protein [Phormidium sp. CCY1219]MEB3827985.1 dynamin family protein [Phormidium sp. CCY1219]
MNNNRVSFDPLTNHLKILQTETIGLLEKIEKLMGIAQSNRGKKDGEKYLQFQQEIHHAIRNVEQLKLKMAIAAPMKAGKSTIVNALIGQPLVPRRNAEMTNLPLEVIFNAQLKQPILRFTPQPISIFEKSFSALQAQITELGIEKVRQQMAESAHFGEELETMAQRSHFSLAAQVSGCEAVCQTLNDCNAIVRLSKIIAPEADPLKFLTELPRIFTPFWGLPKSETPEMRGNLVIVDTPGVNEAGEPQLASVVLEQLRKSSMVAVVLDFTQLKTQAAEDIKQEVQKVIQLRGKENLLVLVNKIDQRREEDMTSEELRQFVAAEFGLGEKADRDRLFEISARQAFVAAQFLQELQEKPGVEIAQLKTARSLAQEVFGIDWEEDLEDATLAQLQKKAQRLWQRSGFAPFLESAIDLLIERAAPRCIKSALNLSKSQILTLCNDTDLQETAVGKSAEELKVQIRRLAEYLYLVELWRKLAKQVEEELKPRLLIEINQDLVSLKRNLRLSLERYFYQEEYRQASPVKKFRVGLVQKINGGQTDRTQGGLQWLESQLEFKSTGYLQFAKLENAQEQADRAYNSVKPELVKALDMKYQAIQTDIADKQGSLVETLQQAMGILGEPYQGWVAAHLPQAIAQPKLKFDPDNIEDLQPSIAENLVLEETADGQRSGNVLGWLPFNQANTPHYSVSVKDIFDICEFAINREVERIRAKAKGYWEIRVKNSLQTVFEQLIALGEKQ